MSGNGKRIEGGNSSRAVTGSERGRHGRLSLLTAVNAIAIVVLVAIVAGSAPALAAVPAAAAAKSQTASRPVTSRDRPFRSAPIRSKGLLKSILSTLGGPSNDVLGGSLDLPEDGNADPSAWTVERSANVLAKHGLLNSDSCGSASTCMAVGYYIDKAGMQVTLAEVWNGSKWSVQKLPKTPGDQASEFLGVSCTSATACTAVGVYLDSSDVQVSLAEAWNGTSWSIETTPNPSGAQISSLEGVSCTSSSKCIAVGGSEDSSGTVTTLAEKRKGTSWSIETTPNPSGSTGSVLDGVYCTSTGACSAVGAYYDSSGTELTLAEAWNSSAWSIETTPNPSGSSGSVLDGVSCTSTGACSAVGDYVSSGAEEALAEEWNGSSWSVEVVPNPSGAQESLLAAVACTSAGRCTGVGGFIDSSGPEMTLAEEWNGSSWSVETTPNPSGAELLSVLAAVACNSAGGCTAAGYSINSSIGEVTLVEVWNGTSWSIKTSANSKGAQESGLFAVACTSASACTAVGTSATYVNATLAEGWNGSSWSIQATPSPSGSQSAAFEGVACTSSNACTAVGLYEDSSGVYVTLAESWNGTSWSVQTTPVPSGAEYSDLDGVACTSTIACTAVGYYYDSSGTQDTLAETWNGTSWSIETTPVPSGAEGSSLAGVSCTSTGPCTAVGYYYDSSGTQDTLAETWNGTSWSIETTPVPSGAEGSSLAGVSCTSTGPCTAVGSYADSSGVRDTLAEVWDGTSWAIQSTPNPSGGQLPTLSGVACTTANGCTAVGDYVTISDVFLTLVEVGPSP